MTKGRLFFLFLVSSVLVMLFLYIGFRLANEAWQWVFLGGLLVMGLAMPFYRLRRETSSAVKFVSEQITYLSLGLISVLLGLALVRDLVLLVTGLFWGFDQAAKLELMTVGSVAFLAAGLLTVAGVFWAHQGLRVREISIPIENLPEALEGFRIAQISDLHIGSTIGPGYVEKVVRLVQKLGPDMTVLTGDIIDGALAQVRPAVEMLVQLPPLNHVFYVPGNHEYYWGFEAYGRALEKMGIHVLLNRGQEMQHKGQSIWVGGVTDPAAEQAGKNAGPDVPAAMRGGQGFDFKMLLSHRPHLVEEASRAGFQLQLSGHTHGGQFFPWTLVVRFAHRYFVGLMQFEKTWIYVNPGTGSWGPPLRMGTTPEVSHLILTRKMSKTSI